MNRNGLYRSIHYRLRQAGIEDMKEVIVASFSQDKTTSLRALGDTELIGLNIHLIQLDKERRMPMRKKIIHLMCLMGFTTSTDKPDYPAIDTWCLAHTKAKKKLNALSYSELIDTTNQVETWYKRELRS